jgi:hypothetical protein
MWNQTNAQISINNLIISGIIQNARHDGLMISVRKLKDSALWQTKNSDGPRYGVCNLSWLKSNVVEL